MFNEEQIRILSVAKDRAIKQVEATDGCEMGAEEFGRLLYAVQQLDWLATPHCDFPVPESGHNGPEEADEPERNLPKVRVERVGNQVLAEIVDEHKTESVAEKVQPEEPKAEPVSVEATPKYSMTDVRAALAKARSKGINVADIIRSFGVENFQQIDASKYPAVMEKLEALNAP